MRATNKRNRTLRNQTGSTLAEVLVTIGIVTGLMGVGVLSLNRGYLNLATARQNLVNDLRRARMQATLKGAHYKFESTGNQYTITRLADGDGDGDWEVDPDFQPKTVALPAGFSVVTFGGATGSAGIAEFDGRGLLVPDETGSLSIISVTVSDSSGQAETLQIWPSGQVESARLS